MLPTSTRGVNALLRSRYAFAGRGGPHIPTKSDLGDHGPRENIEIHNPATGDLLSTIEVPSPSEIEQTIQRAHDVFVQSAWSDPSLALARSKVLSALARRLETRISEFAELESLQTGRCIREMRVQIGRLPEWLDYYAALLRTLPAGFVAPTQGQLVNHVTRVPLGVVAQITPFNHPLLISIKKIAPALAAGNCVIVKPSELAPISIIEFATLAHEAGVPQDVLSVLPGGPSVGKALISDRRVRKVDITAGTSTGRAIGSAVGHNVASFTAELGGKAPIIVFEDADIESAVNGVAFASFIASGQTCVSGTRILVQSGSSNAFYNKFKERFIEKVRSITQRMGNPINPKSSMGPVISASALKRVDRTVSEARSQPHVQVLVGGERMTGPSPLDGFPLDRGFFFPPTIVEGIKRSDELWREEVFGPVVTITPFEQEKDAIDLANDCKYGLGSGIWTSNLSRAHRVARMMESGICWVNTHHRNDPSSPWGGLKESGIGRENGVEALESYSQSKSTVINIADPSESRVSDDWFASTDEERRYG